MRTTIIGRASAWGAAYGSALWSIFGMVVLRVILDMPIAVETSALMSLVGHLVFGVVTGVTHAALIRTREDPVTRHRVSRAGP